MDNPRHQNFELLYKKFALPLMKFLIKKCGGDQKVAEEVFSQTILAAFKGWEAFEHKSSFFTWVCRIGLNKMADYYRGQVNQRSGIIAPGLEFLAQIKSKEPSPEEKLALEELRRSVHECLNLLPDDKRQLLYFRYWKEMSLKAISEALGISERSVEGKLYRARFAFREVMQIKYPDLVKNS